MVRMICSEGASSKKVRASLERTIEGASGTGFTVSFNDFVTSVVSSLAISETFASPNLSLRGMSFKEQLVLEPVIKIEDRGRRETLDDDTLTELHPKLGSSSSRALNGTISSSSSSITLSLKSDREGLDLN